MGLGPPLAVQRLLMDSDVLEIYVIAKRSAAHTHTQRGGSMENLKEKDPRAVPSLVCSDCSGYLGIFLKMSFVPGHLCD